MCDQQSLRSACAYAQSDQSLCVSLEYSMSVKLLTEHHLEFLSLKGGCTGSSESSNVKMSHGWKSHVVANSRKHIKQIAWRFCPYKRKTTEIIYRLLFVNTNQETLLLQIPKITKKEKQARKAPYLE